MSYFYDLEKRGIFGAPKRGLREPGAELFKTHKTGMIGVPSHRALATRLWSRAVTVYKGSSRDKTSIRHAVVLYLILSSGTLQKSRRIFQAWHHIYSFSPNYIIRTFKCIGIFTRRSQRNPLNTIHEKLTAFLSAPKFITVFAYVRHSTLP
jgi:hypothetical protein